MALLWRECGGLRCGEDRLTVSSSMMKLHAGSSVWSHIVLIPSSASTVGRRSGLLEDVARGFSMDTRFI